MISEDEIDAAATKLRANLEHMLGAFDVVEAYQVRLEVHGGTPRPLCVDSGLDFISNPGGFAIGAKTKPNRFRRQLALCESCQLTDECLRIALREGNTEGIWGGTMPRDRKGQYA